MTLSFAYSDVPGYEYDLTLARNDNVTVEWDMEVSDLSLPVPIGAKPFQVELLDGSKWELPRIYRIKQSFTTYPNMLLTSILVTIVTWDKVNNRTNISKRLANYGELLTRWYAARSRWITTDVLTDAKVMLNSNDLNYEKHENVRWMKKVMVEFETAAPADLSDAGTALKAKASVNPPQITDGKPNPPSLLRRGVTPGK